MLFTEVQLFGAFVLIYLIIWLIMYVRYLLYVYCSKRIKVQRVNSLESRVVKFRKWGWLVLLLFPFTVFLFPQVDVINQEPNIEIDEDLREKIELEVELYQVPLEDVLLRFSFHRDSYMSLYSFKGKFLPLGKYIFNNTDSTLNLYWTKFRGETPVDISPVDGDRDFPPKELVKYSDLTGYINIFFRDPRHSYSSSTKEGVLRSIYTLDVKYVAQRQKRELIEQIANNSWKPYWLVEEPCTMPQIFPIRPDSVLSNLEKLELYYDSIASISKATNLY